MKHRLIIGCLALIIIAVIAACQAGGPTAESNTNSSNSNATATASPAGEARPIVTDIQAVLAKHDKALNEKNLDDLMTTFSSDPKTVVLGTGVEEKWVGQQAIRAAYTEIVKDYDPNTLTTNCDWKTGDADDGGTMAWLAATCNCKDSFKGVVRQYGLNVTASLKKEGGSWHFVMLHMSNAIGPPSNSAPGGANGK